MLNERVPAKPIPSTVPTRHIRTPKRPPLPDMAAVLLPGLQQASALLAVATKILSDLSSHPPQRKGNAATEALKARRLLAAFGRVPKRS